jgi:hypothetical protein
MRAAGIWLFGIWVVTAATTNTPLRGEHRISLVGNRQEASGPTDSASPSQIRVSIAADPRETPRPVAALDPSQINVSVVGDTLETSPLPDSIRRPLVLDTAGYTMLGSRDLDLPFVPGTRLALGVLPDADHFGGELVYFGQHN